MPRPRKNNGNNAAGNAGAKPQEFVKLESFEVVRAQEFTRQDGQSWHVADLKINGVTVYGCRAVTYKDKQTGEDKDFLGWPERKGSDGKYYKWAYCNLSADDQQKICDAIWAKLDGK